MLKTIRKMFEGGRTAGTASATKKNLKERGLRMELCEDRVLLTASPLQADLPSINDTAYTALDFTPETDVLEAVVVNMDSVNMAAEQGTPVAQPMAADPVSVSNAADLQAAITDGNSVTLTTDITLDTTTSKITFPATYNGTINGASHSISGADTYQAFVIPSDATVTMSDLTITNARHVNESTVQKNLGGAIENYGTLTLSNMTISNCYSEMSGGAIYNAGTLTATDVTFNDNVCGYDETSQYSETDGGYGGALGNQGRAVLNNCVITGSTLKDDNGDVVYKFNGRTGAGIYNETMGYGPATLTLNGVTIQNCQSSGELGGALFTYRSSASVIFQGTDNKIINNTTDENVGSGGGIVGYSTSITITDGAELNVTGNSASYSTSSGGGGILTFGTDIEVAGSLNVSGNSASDGAGMEMESSSTLTIKDGGSVVVKNNSGDTENKEANRGYGGGIYAGSAAITVENGASLIVEGNAVVTDGEDTANGAGLILGGNSTLTVAPGATLAVADNTVQTAGDSTTKQQDNLSVKEGTKVNGDIAVAGTNTIAGTVNGDVQASGNTTISGTVTGVVAADEGGTVTLTDGASVAGIAANTEVTIPAGTAVQVGDKVVATGTEPATVKVENDSVVVSGEGVTETSTVISGKVRCVGGNYDFTNLPVTTIGSKEYYNIGGNYYEPSVVVTNNYATIQDAVDAAVAGDVIDINASTFTNSTIKLDATLVINKSVTIVGNGVTFDRGLWVKDGDNYKHVGTGTGRVMELNNPDASVTLANMTITGGYFNNGAGYGAGIFCCVKELTLDNVNIVGNHTGIDGAGLAIANSAIVTITDGSISENTASVYDNGTSGQKASGAAIVNYYGTNPVIKIDGTEFKGNTAEQGGAFFFNQGATVTITGAVFEDNTATKAAGGAIHSSGSTDLPINITIEDTLFTGNNSAWGGSAIHQRSGDLEISNSSFIGNESSSNGAAILTAADKSVVDVTLNQVLAAGNTSGTGDDLIQSDVVLFGEKYNTQITEESSNNVIGSYSATPGTGSVANNATNTMSGTPVEPLAVLDEDGNLKDFLNDGTTPLVGVGSSDENVISEVSEAKSCVVTDGGDTVSALVTLREAIENAVALGKTEVTVDSTIDAISLADDLSIPAGITVDLGTATITANSMTVTVSGAITAASNKNMPLASNETGQFVFEAGDYSKLKLGDTVFVGSEGLVQVNTGTISVSSMSNTTGAITVPADSTVTIAGATNNGKFTLGSGLTLNVAGKLNVNVPMVCLGTITAADGSITLGDNAFLTYPTETIKAAFSNMDVTPVENTDGSFTYYPTFQAAIENADGGTVTLKENLLLTSSFVLNNSITIDGAGKSITYADDATGFPLIQVGKNGLEIGFQNVTITNGKSTDVGGGIRNFTNSTLALEDVTMTGCSSEMRGGAVYSQGDVTVTGNCSFSGNTSKGGSAIYVDNGAALTITGAGEEGDTGVVFTGNNGSAVYVTGPTAVKGATFQENNGISFHIENSNSTNTFENTEFIANKDTAMQIDGGTVSFNGGVLFAGNVGGNAGAIYQAGGKITSDYNGNLFAAQFISNEGFRGGAIFANGSVDLTHMFFARNQATYGGAIFVEFNGNVTATESASISQNYATTYGGAIYNDGCVDVTNMTISNNWAGTNYGALYNGGTAEGTDSLTQPNFVVNAAHATGIVYNTTVDNNRLMILPEAAETDDSVYEMYTYSQLTVPYGKDGYISDTEIAKTTAANAALALKYLDGITGTDSATKDTTIANFGEVFISAQYEQYVSPQNYGAEGDNDYNWLRDTAKWEFANDMGTIVKAKFSAVNAPIAACDFDDSGKVDMADFVDFAQSFNSTDSAKDFDGNGKVDMGDFVHFAQQFNKQVLDLAQEEALAMKAATAAELPEAPTAQPVVVVEAAPVAEAAAAALPEAAPVVVDAPKATVREVVNFWDSYDALDDVVDAEIVTPTADDASLFGDDEVELFETEALEELAIEL